MKSLYLCIWKKFFNVLFKLQEPCKSLKFSVVHRKNMRPISPGAKMKSENPHCVGNSLPADKCILFKYQEVLGHPG